MPKKPDPFATPKRVLRLLAAAALVTAAPAAADTPSSPDPQRATEVVESLHTHLLEVMKRAESLGYEGRYTELEPVLRSLFDIPFMAEKSVGRHWKDAGPEQRQNLLETFARFTIANYAGRFDGYSGQDFETLSNDAATRGTRLVRTRLVGENEVVQLNYRLRPVDGEWKIIDVYLNGTVSELALRRAEYSSLIRREGFSALLVALDEKISDLASAPADRSS